MSYLPNISTGNTLWVDAINGNDSTGLRGKKDKPFLTIGAALGAVGISTGDTVMVLPGTYAESPGTIPVGVSLVSQGGYEVTAITGAAVTGNRITLSSGSVINGFNVTIPSDATNAIQYAGAAATVAGCRFIEFTGQAAALGSGLANTGPGKIIAFEVRYGLLDCENILLCSNGILAIQSLHVPGSGTIQRGAKVSGGRLQALDVNIGNANVLYGVEIGTGGVAVLISLNLFNLKNGLLVTGNDVQIDALGGKIQTTAVQAGSYGGGLSSFTGRALVVDSALSLSAATIRITAQMEPNFVFNNTLVPNAASSDFVVNAMQATTDEREASQRLLGTDSQIGFPEKGGKLMTGEGGPNATFNTVVTVNAAGAVTDITDLAKSTSAGTFTFNNIATDESIAWCSIRRDGITADLLKVFGIVLNQQTAGTDGGTAPTYVFEVFSGGVVSTVNTIVGGTTYVDGTLNVPVIGGSGLGMTVDITTAGVPGPVTVVTVNQGGSGYLTGETVTISGGTGDATVNTLATTSIVWTEVGAQAVSEAEQYRYANNVFLRASSVEQIRLGVDSDTAWDVETLERFKTTLTFGGFGFTATDTVTLGTNVTTLTGIGGPGGDDAATAYLANFVADSEAIEAKVGNSIYEVIVTVDHLPISFSKTGAGGATITPAAATTSLTGYWSRVRINAINGASTLPTFNQLKTTPNLTMWNEKGQKTSHGLAMWRKALFGVSGIFSELDGDLGVDAKQIDIGGTPPAPPNTWNLKIKKAHLAAGKAIAYQFNLPAGICTAYPLKLKITIGEDALATGVSSNVRPVMSLSRLAVENNLIADTTAGGIVPIARTVTQATDWESTSNITVKGVGDPLVVVTGKKLTSTQFEFDISDLYEDDIAAIIISNTDATFTSTFDVWTMEVEGIVFTDGKIL